MNNDNENYKDNDEFGERIRKENGSYKELPIYKIAERITELCAAIGDSLSSESEMFNLKREMLASSDAIEARIIEINYEDSYNTKMESAVLLKLNADDLLEHISFCEDENFCDKDYLETLKAEIEKLRLYFIGWIKIFDKSKNSDGVEWGLF